MLLDDIKPPHIAEYLRQCGQTSKVQANREKAVFSTLFNHARGWGMTEAVNPSMGVRGHREQRRERYVDDAEYGLVYAHAPDSVKHTMDLALLTAQRPADVLALRCNDVRNGFVEVQQSKTGKRVRVRVQGELSTLLEKNRSTVSQTSQRVPVD